MRRAFKINLSRLFSLLLAVGLCLVVALSCTSSGPRKNEEKEKREKESSQTTPPRRVESQQPVAPSHKSRSNRVQPQSPGR